MAEPDTNINLLSAHLCAAGVPEFDVFKTPDKSGIYTVQFHVSAAYAALLQGKIKLASDVRSINPSVLQTIPSKYCADLSEGAVGLVCAELAAIGPDAGPDGAAFAINKLVRRLRYA